MDSIGPCLVATYSLFIVIGHYSLCLSDYWSLWLLFWESRWRGGLQSSVSIKNIDFENGWKSEQRSDDPPTTFFHLFVSPAEATPEAFTARLSNALVIYCISLCISSSSSFQPSLFIHFHLQFDTTSTHNEAMDKLQISEEDPKLWTYVKRKFRLCCEVYNILAVPQSQNSQNQIPRDWRCVPANRWESFFANLKSKPVW